jgi:hypothetical protein
MHFIDQVIDWLVPYLGSEKVTQVEQLPLDPEIRSISLTGYNGAIRWMPLELGVQPYVVVEKEVQGSSEEVIRPYLDSMSVEDRSTGSHAVFCAIQPPPPSGVRTSQIKFTLYASPDQIDVFQAQTSNGRIQIHTAFTCVLDLRTKNGRIQLSSGSGSVQLSASNGRIELGQIHLTNSSAVTTSNGRINGMVTFPPHGEFVFATTNGSVDLEIPEDTKGSFNLSTNNGHADLSLGRTIIKGQRNIVVSHESGPSIKINTSNGYISVKQSSQE